ncbi:class I SAM-dependent methyltransferase [Pedococcus sp. P5_B7]
MARQRPVGTITRGTTNPNRLRRVDRWLAGPQAWRLRRPGQPPIVVDLGYGASPVTAVELHDRLTRVRRDVEVVGIEIEPNRVALGRPLEREGLSFRLGGFEVPLDGRQATVVRAFNVLRQYDESEVAQAWATVQQRLTPDGLLVDGTCDELGRRSAWIAVDRSGPVSLSLSWRLRGLDRPSDIAERLPKSLIHRNVEGEAVHDWLRALDDAWLRAAHQASFGVRQRFLAAVETVRAEGWPVADGPARWRLGEVTVDWSAVAPAT